MCDCNKRCEILKEQNSLMLELGGILLDAINELREASKENQILVHSCGAVSIEYSLRKKLAELAENEHVKKIEREKWNQK